MSSAYISEIIRASLSAIDKGQWEADKVAWLENKRDLPKNHHSSSLSVALPPLSNVLLDMVKSTS
jgi:cystine transport system permease protein